MGRAAGVRGARSAPSPALQLWNDYFATRERLRANVIRAGEAGGAACDGTGLLKGMISCGHCGRRMQVAFGHQRPRPALCMRAPTTQNRIRLV